MNTNHAIEDNLNKVFVKDRHGIVTRAVLVGLRKRKVELQCPDRQDKYSVSVAEFNKHYRPE